MGLRHLVSGQGSRGFSAVFCCGSTRWRGCRDSEKRGDKEKQSHNFVLYNYIFVRSSLRVSSLDRPNESNAPMMRQPNQEPSVLPIATSSDATRRRANLAAPPNDELGDEVRGSWSEMPSRSYFSSHGHTDGKALTRGHVSATVGSWPFH